MNRILFEPSEVINNHVEFGGIRAEHVVNVLHGERGQTLKTGLLSGLIGTSTILEVAKGPIVRVSCEHTEKALPTWIDLVLAPPRPRVMKRLLPQLASMGVGRIVLVGAKKVEKDFWGATLLKEENYRPLLIDGLMQAGTTELPELILRRNFRKFINDELETMFATSNRIVAHPYGEGEVGEKGIHSAAKRPLLAIGPEGGWTDEEVALLEEHGFRRYSLGARILRTDTATIALLARLMEAMA